MTDSSNADDWRAVAALAELAVRRGHYADAAAQASRALALARDSRRLDEWDEAAAQAVDIHRLAGLTSAAVKVVAELCDRDPGATPGPFMARALASIASLLQRPHHSLAYRLAGLGPEGAPGWKVDDHLAQARCHLDLGEVEMASRCVDRAVALDQPSSTSPIAVTRAEIALAAGDLTNAEAESRRALRAAESHTHPANLALLARAAVHAASGRPAEVLSLLTGSETTAAGRHTTRLARGT